MSPSQTNPDEAAQGKSARFDITAIATSFPPTASTLLIDRYLTNRAAASARIFRVYKETPPHYHATCDEYLFVLTGRGTFWMENPATKAGAHRMGVIAMSRYQFIVRDPASSVWWM